MTEKVAAIILAAGTSQRMGGINKLFVPLKGKPLLAWCVDACEQFSSISQIVLVLNEKDLVRGEVLKEKRGWSKVIICRGGPRRQDSVKQGLAQLKDCDWVVIHDGARPFLTADLIGQGLREARRTGAAVAGVPVKETIKLVNSRKLTVAQTLQRDKLWAAQTPQVFRLELLMRAYESLACEVTDDASAVEQLGFEVKLYMGDYRNIKVTTPDDLALARIIAKKM